MLTARRTATAFRFDAVHLRAHILQFSWSGEDHLDVVPASYLFDAVPDLMHAWHDDWPFLLLFTPSSRRALSFASVYFFAALYLHCFICAWHFIWNHATYGSFSQTAYLLPDCFIRFVTISISHNIWVLLMFLLVYYLMLISFLPLVMYWFIYFTYLLVMRSLLTIFHFGAFLCCTQSHSLSYYFSNKSEI